MSRRHQGGQHLSGRAMMRDATDIEDACHAVNAINRRIKHLQGSGRPEPERERVKVTLSPILDEWLKREVP